MKIQTKTEISLITFVFLGVSAIVFAAAFAEKQEYIVTHYVEGRPAKIYRTHVVLKGFASDTFTFIDQSTGKEVTISGTIVVEQK